jgi:hypothetical protein
MVTRQPRCPERDALVLAQNVPGEPVGIGFGPTFGIGERIELAVRLLERLYDPVPHQERTPVGGLLVVDGLHRVPQRDDAILRQGKCGRVRGVDHVAVAPHQRASVSIGAQGQLLQHIRRSTNRGVSADYA